MQFLQFDLNLAKSKFFLRYKFEKLYGYFENIGWRNCQLKIYLTKKTNGSKLQLINKL